MFNAKPLVKFVKPDELPTEDFHPETLEGVFNDDNLLTLICNQLPRKEQAMVAASCKKFYDFMHQHYFDSIYGRTLACIKYMENELSEFTKSINNYSKEQNSLFFTYRRMPLYLQILTPLAIVGCIAVIGFVVFGGVSFRKALQATDKLIMLGFGLVVMNYRSIQAHINQPLDAISLNSMERIRNNSPLLTFLLSRENMTSLTQNNLNLFLQQIKNDVSWSLSQFENYHKGLIGQGGVPSVELDQVGGEKDQKILKFLLDKWNEIHPEADKQVNYASSLSLT
jgi:hypothetical protein